ELTGNTTDPNTDVYNKEYRSVLADSSRVDANGISLFPENMELNYPNSNGRIPGRAFDNDPSDPGEPTKWDVELTPQKGHNWDYITEPFKYHHSIYFGPGGYHVDVATRISKHGNLANEEVVIVPRSNSYIKLHPDAVINVNPNNY